MSVQWSPSKITMPCQKYIDHFAEPESIIIDNVHFEHCLVIPAYAEDLSFLDNIEQLLRATQKKICVILVINVPSQASIEDITKNRVVLAAIAARYEKTHAHHHVSAHIYLQHVLCVVDRTTTPLPEKQGVGLARKIGCDVALRLWMAGTIASDCIHISDADVNFPEDYFQQVQVDLGVSAWIYQFRHMPDDNPVLAQGIADYELYLQSYVDGLAFAGSPYAFQTVGSTMAVHPLAYAKVRGFPRRAAAEDFYMLNKLAKVGRIVQLDGDPLRLSGRTSHRVPFGTGDAMNQVAQGRKYIPYPAICFDYLKIWQAVINNSVIEEDLQTFRHRIAIACEQCGLAANPLIDVLTNLGVFHVFATIQAKQKKCLIIFWHTWFDGFKTLKFVKAFLIY